MGQTSSQNLKSELIGPNAWLAVYRNLPRGTETVNVSLVVGQAFCVYAEAKFDALTKVKA